MREKPKKTFGKNFVYIGVWMNINININKRESGGFSWIYGDDIILI